MNKLLPLVTSITTLASIPVLNEYKIFHEPKYILTSFCENRTFEKENYKGVHKWSEIFLNSENDYDNLCYKEYLMLHNYLKEPEINEERINDFIKSLMKKEDFEYIYFFVFFKLSEYEKNSLLSFILSSDIDIFNDWYKKSLKSCFDSSDLVLSNKAKDIYNLYLERFEQIICM